MEIALFQIGWLILSVFQFGVASHFLFLYKKDNDKRKLMFGVSFIIGVFSVMYTALGFHNTGSESILLGNIYYWSFLPILIAIFTTAHHTLLKMKYRQFFFKSFFFFVVFSFIFLIIYPLPAGETLSPIVTVASFEVVVVSLLLFLRRKEISDLIFLLAVISFLFGGMSTAMGFEQYFQIYAFFIGYVFFLLLFAYPSIPRKDKNDGMANLFALQKKLDDTERSLQVTAERYHDLFQHIKSGVTVYESVGDGTDFVIRDFNHAAEIIENISRDKVIGKRVTDVFPGVKEFGLFDVLKEVWMTGNPKHHPASFYSDGRLTGWRDSTAYKLSSGEIVVVYDDVTVEKQREIALQEAHDELKELNEALDKKVEERTEQVNHLLKQKDDFINQLGHDLKNPLGPFIHLLPVLKKYISDEKNKHIIDVLDRNAHYMRELVDKTIELAKLNSDKTVFSYEDCDLRWLIDEVIADNKIFFEENNIKFYNRIPSNLIVYLDVPHIREVFINLFTNAVKYSNGRGKVSVSAERCDNVIKVSVSDNGNGIGEDQMKYLFDEYFKVDGSRHDFESSGLGLPICKRIIEKHGGKIWGESPGLGKGSTFYFTLPLEPMRQFDTMENLSSAYDKINEKVDQVIAGQ